MITEVVNGIDEILLWRDLNFRVVVSKLKIALYTFLGLVFSAGIIVIDLCTERSNIVDLLIVILAVLGLICWLITLFDYRDIKQITRTDTSNLIELSTLRSNWLDPTFPLQFCKLVSNDSIRSMRVTDDSFGALWHVGKEFGCYEAKVKYLPNIPDNTVVIYNDGLYVSYKYMPCIEDEKEQRSTDEKES